MPFNGSGTFASTYSWVQDANNGLAISSSRMDAQELDYTSNGFGNCLTRDGQGIATANLPMGTFRHTGVGNGVALTDYLAVNQLQSAGPIFAVAGGTADALTATFSPAITTLVDGHTVYVRATAANATTTPTFSPNGLTARTITKNGGSALAANDIVNNQAITLRYRLGNTTWDLVNPNAGQAGLLGANNTWTGTNTFNAAITYGGVTLSNAVTGTGNMVLSASPTLSGTVAGTLTFSGALTLSSALTYGGVTLSNAVTGTGNMVLSASPTLSGTVAGTLTFSGALTLSSALTYGGVTLSNAVTGTGNMVLSASPTLSGTIAGALTFSGLQTYSAGGNITQAATPATNAVGYLGLPDSAGSGTSSYAAVMVDAGCMIRLNGSSLTATIPANGSVAYPVGTTLTFYNANATALSIAITTDTLTLANSSSTGTRTLAKNGVATAMKLTSTTWVISGAGLT